MTKYREIKPSAIGDETLVEFRPTSLSTVAWIMVLAVARRYVGRVMTVREFVDDMGRVIPTGGYLFSGACDCGSPGCSSRDHGVLSYVRMEACDECGEPYYFPPEPILDLVVVVPEVESDG